MTENTSPDHQADDLGLTARQWHDLAVAYTHGLLEPEPGTVEDKAFGQLDRYTRSDLTYYAETAGQARQEPSHCAPHAAPELEAGQ